MMRSRRSFIDVLERVCARGIVFDLEQDLDASSAGSGSPAWFRLSTAGVHVFKIDDGIAWLFQRLEQAY
jgi:hypothetical protein